VKEEEVDKPALVIKYKPRFRKDPPTGTPLASGSAFVETADEDRVQPDADGRIPLPHYGEWQTEPFQPPRLENGIVPKNKFGNVELWNEKCMPIGCELVDHPLAAGVAAALSIDYAKALRGFVRKQGRMVPDLRGIVVAQEHADIVLLGAHERQQEKDAKALEKKQKKIWKSWKRVINRVLVRDRLDREYGDRVTKECSSQKPKGQSGVDAGAPAAAMQSAEGTGEISARLIDSSARLSAMASMLSTVNEGAADPPTQQLDPEAEPSNSTGSMKAEAQPMADGSEIPSHNSAGENSGSKPSSGTDVEFI